MTPKVIESLGEAPISLEEARAHVEAPSYGDSDVDPTDDAMLEGFLAAAQEYCENYCGLSFSTRVLEVALDEFPRECPAWFTSRWKRQGVDLPMGPVSSVDTVSWGDESDEEMNNDTFTLDAYAAAARLYPVTSWPVVTCGVNRIKIRYVAGYGEESDGGAGPLPKSIRAAILLVLGHLYANREETTEASLMNLPLGVKALLDPYRVRLGFA